MSELEFQFRWVGKSLDRAFAALEQEITEVVRGLTVKLWDSILVKTPQYAGGMAASWSYSIGAPQFYDRSNMIDPGLIGASRRGDQWQSVTPLRRGHRAAITIANDDNAGSETGFRLGDTVYIANGVDHGEGPYSYDVETGKVRLRAANLPGAPVRKSLDLIHSRYAENVTPQAAAALRQLRIGGSSAASDT